jgi:hypothetical protein
LPRFLPSSRHHSHAATFRVGSHAFATLRPPAFTTARRFSPRTSLQAYFIPQPRSGSAPVQGSSLLAQPPFLIGRSYPLAVVPRSAHQYDRLPDRAGCHGLRSSTSRPSSTRGRVHRAAVIHNDSRRSPHRVCLLQALTRPVDRTLLAISALDVAGSLPSLSRSQTPLVLSVSPARA